MDQNQINVMAAEAFAVDWVAAACMTVLLYDNFITFGQEVSTMWNRRISIVKILFFLNRYLVVGMLCFNAIASSQSFLSHGFCKFYLRFLVCTITITNSVVEGILVARVWAIYKGHQYAIAFAMFFYISGICVLVGLTIKDYVGEAVVIVDDFRELPGCYAQSVPKIIAGYWISPLVIESIFFVMVSWRAYSWWRSEAPVPPTMALLARDSTIYFLSIFVLLIANLFVFEFGPPFLSSMMVTPSNTAGCIAGSRMLLNMRTLGRGYEATTEIEMTGIRFHSHRYVMRRAGLTSTSIGEYTSTFGADTVAGLSPIAEVTTSETVVDKA